MTGCLLFNWFSRLFCWLLYCNLCRLLRNHFFCSRLRDLFRGCLYSRFFCCRFFVNRFFHWLGSFFLCRLFFASHTFKLFLKQSLLIEYHSLQFLFHYCFPLKIPVCQPEFRRKYSL